MIKKIIIPTLVAITLTGCYQTVNQNDIQTAIRACDNKLENIVEIQATVVGDERVTCTNRKYIYLDSTIWVQK